MTPTRLLSVGRASGDLGSLSPDNAAKLAKVTAIAGKFLGRSIFGPKWIQIGPILGRKWRILAYFRALRARKGAETLKARTMRLAAQFKGFQLTFRRVLGLRPKTGQTTPKMAQKGPFFWEKVYGSLGFSCFDLGKEVVNFNKFFNKNFVKN